MDKYNNAQTYGKTSRGGSPGGLLRFYEIYASLLRRVKIITYIVPVAVDNLGSRRSAEKTKGDGQANSCDRVARNSKKNVGNEYARHGGVQLTDGPFFKMRPEGVTSYLRHNDDKRRGTARNRTGVTRTPAVRILSDNRYTTAPYSPFAGEASII